VAKNRKRKHQGHPAKQQQRRDAGEGLRRAAEDLNRRAAQEGKTPGELVSEMTGRSAIPFDRATLGAMEWAGEGLAELPPETQRQLVEQGIAKDVRIAVGGEGAAAGLAGMLLDPNSNQIVGTLPGTAAAALMPEDLERLSGYEFAAKGEPVSLDDLVAGLMPNMEAGLGDVPAEVAEGVRQKVREQVAEVADEMVAEGLLSRKGDGYTGLGTRAQMERIVGRLADSNVAVDAERSLRDAGYAPVPAADWIRLDEALGEKTQLLFDVRRAAPTAGLSETGQLTGEVAEEQQAEMKRMLRLHSERPESRTAALALLRRLGWGPGELDATALGLSWRQKTLAGLERAAEPRDPGTTPDAREVAFHIVEHLHTLAPGWGIEPTEVRPSDVTMRAFDGDLHVRVTGMLGEAVGAAARVLQLTPEKIVQDAMRGIVETTTFADVTSSELPVQGSTTSERMLSLAIEKLARNEWPEDETYADAQRMPVPEPIPLTYVGLAQLVAQARPQKYPRRILQSELMHADAKLMHDVVAGWRIQHPKLGTFVRTAVTIKVRDAKRDALLLHDVPAQTWEALRGVGAQVPVSQTVEGLDAGMPEEYRLGSADRPRWAGARAFDKVWERCMTLAELGYRSVDEGRNVVDICREAGGWTEQHLTQARAIIGFSTTALAGMRDATEVLVDPDQVNAMPPFEEWDQAVGYAKALHLPFEDVFLDLEGPAGSCAIERAEGAETVLALRGAHVRREGEVLMILPFGAFCRAGETDGDRTYNPLGLVAVGIDRPTPDAIWGVQAVTDDGYMHAHLAADASVAMTPFRLPHGAMATEEEGLVTVRLTPDIPERSRVECFTLHDAEMGEVDKGTLAILVAQLASSALVVLKALNLMDMSNVEIVQAPLERPARRLAERKGIPISLAVKIHTSTKRYTGSNGEGSHIEYSHRFRVRGHVKHYPVGTRMADARPDQVRPCGRCGRCRRIWTPPFTKGPEGKPLVLKSLVLEDERKPLSLE
jgi:hypothetical protein